MDVAGNVSELMAQSVRASLSGVCLTERHRFKS